MFPPDPALLLSGFRGCVASSGVLRLLSIKWYRKARGAGALPLRQTQRSSLIEPVANSIKGGAHLRLAARPIASLGPPATGSSHRVRRCLPRRMTSATKCHTQNGMSDRITRILVVDKDAIITVNWAMRFGSVSI